jgi:hypothetical protein
MTLKYLIFMDIQFAESISTLPYLMCVKLMLSRIDRRKGRAIGGTLWIASVMILVVGVIVGPCDFTGCSIPLNGNKRETEEDKQIKWCDPQQLAFPRRMSLNSSRGGL